MRTTLVIPDMVFRNAKKKAAEKGVSLSKFVEDALRSVLSAGGPSKKDYRLKFPIIKGKIQPGVDIADRDSLFARMES